MFVFNGWVTLLAFIAPLINLVAHAQSNSPAGGYIAITGVQTGINTATGELPARKNILDLQNDEPAWSLYIQAFNALQTTDENDPLSWFQIAGIHGRPFIPWNNFNQYQGAQYNWWKGYCTHVSVLFTSWHRPYLALLEQAIGQSAQRIAKTYTGPDLLIFQDAADRLRLPYWDWAATPEMPPVVSQPTVQIKTPTGQQTVNNPLFQYKFQQFPLNPTYFPPNLDERAKRPFTVRQPESGDPNSPSRPEVINAQLRTGNYMQRTWDALVKSTDYNGFSTESAPGTSVEAIHDSIHGIIGGDHGHMTRLEYSAFDPIFWLHHTNVDRLYAIWMAINPGKLMAPLAHESGTMSIPSGNNDNTDTPLWPFTSDATGTVYTSSSIYELSTFGYTYPEIGDWSQTVESLRSNVTAQVNAKYDPNSIFRNAPSVRRRDGFMPGQETVEWSVSISVSKFGLAGAHFAIRLFLGTVPSNPQDWATCDSGLGSMQIMPPVMQNGTSKPTIIVYDEFSLTKAIVDAGHNAGDIEACKKYLKDSLQWRVQKHDGTVVDITSLPSLNVTVSDQKVTLQQNITSLPTYGQRTDHQEITDKPAPDKPLTANAGSSIASDGTLWGSWALFVFVGMLLM